MRNRKSGTPVKNTRKTRSFLLPRVGEDRTFDFALDRDEFKGMQPGDQVLAIKQTRSFVTIVKLILSEIDRQRSLPRSGDLSKKKRGTMPRFTALDRQHCRHQ